MKVEKAGCYTLTTGNGVLKYLFRCCVCMVNIQEDKVCIVDDKEPHNRICEPCGQRVCSVVQGCL